MFNKKETSEQTTPTGQVAPSPPPLPQANAPAQAAASHGASTLLADGCEFEGTANVAGTLRIEGTANGEIEASDCVVIGKSGKVNAEVKTRRAVLNGKFTGKIDAEDCVEMQSGSNVEAQVHARNMVMEDGVQFEGNCKIGK